MTVTGKVVNVAGMSSFWCYVAALLGLGALGIALPRQELQIQYGATFDHIDPVTSIVVLHQYRFLKVFALGFGVWALISWRDILQGQRRGPLRLFLFVLFTGVLARGISMLLDGRPPTLLIAFTASEAFFGVCVLARSRYRRCAR